jgi:hypothetical protein
VRKLARARFSFRAWRIFQPRKCPEGRNQMRHPFAGTDRKSCIPLAKWQSLEVHAIICRTRGKSFLKN